MKKKLFLLAIGLFFLVGCAGENVKTQSSVDLPYEIANDEIKEFKDEGLEHYTDYQVLEEVTIRDLTDEENEKFLERMKDNTLNTLNSEYSAVEFYFGDTEQIDRNNKSIYKFDEDHSNFVYNDELVSTPFYQISIYKNKESLSRYDDKREEEVGYGEVLDDFKIISIVNKDYVKKGLQLKTTINDKVVYIDIK